MEDVTRLEMGLASEWETTFEPWEFANAIQRSVDAQFLQASPQNVLFGFTRLVDQRYRLTPDVLQTLADAAVGDGDHEELLNAIQAIPDRDS